MKENVLIDSQIDNEEKIRVLVDYAPVVKDVVIVPQPTKYGTFYNAHADIVGIGEIKVRVDENLVRYIKTCQKLNIKPFKSKLVVKEINEEKNKTYSCVKFISNRDKAFRYFIARADEETLEMIYDDYQEKNKK